MTDFFYNWTVQIMKAKKQWKPGLILSIGLAAVIGCSQQQKVDTARVNVLTMKSIPDGHFLANFQLRGQEQMLNFKFQNGSARCVNSSDPKLKGLQGRFEWIGNGVFMVSLQNENYRASQFWVFREDGGASIKEMPDRGEQQEATPVSDDTIEPR
jgi:hypothetical protein